ncbi:alpha/beta fold hydrolase [Maridesulfovibrio sp.]|uniref:alpha/beta hydrolase n=1 Tax=Maridesulfovibrio sp. TaxID=2795000 RepID=UPI002AA620E1|nr:alpha/beta fold hydrolase [Maridesulfovibrio sp.]
MKIRKEMILVRKAIPTIIALLLVYLLTYLLFLDHPDYVDEIVQDILFSISALVLLAITIRFFSLIMGITRIRREFGRYVVDKFTHTINQCKPLHQSFGKKKKHAVILLHGFISSPIVFDGLLQELNDNQIDYHAPLIHGFGVKRVQLLFSLTEDEWVRQVTETYDILASQYEHVSVIGHSLGGTLALYLSQIRPVKHLILLAPAIFPCSTQRVHNLLAENKFLYALVPWVFPLLPIFDKMRDDFDKKTAEKYNLYSVAPTRGAFNVLRLQAKIDVKKAQYETLDLFYGANDMAVDGEKVWDYFKQNNALHRVHRFDHTGHNPLIDGEGDFAGWIVGHILREELAWPPCKCNGAA